MGRKCNVLHCLSDSRRIEDQGVTFHKMPTHTDLRPKWLSLCRIPEERKNVKVIYVCSRHFLKADFCNFKGTKYMLKQGALPSVFPWTACEKIEQSKNDPKSNIDDDDKDESLNIGNLRSEIKSEPEDENDEDSSEEDKKIDVSNIVTGELNTSSQMNEDSFKIKEEMFVKKDCSKSESQESLVQSCSDESGKINFTPGTRIEANDFHDKWYSAKIIEVDYDEKEVFIHFEKCPNRGNEWIPMDSSRLRPLRPVKKTDVFKVGDRCIATWSDTRKFPATINRIIDSETFEVLFDDGYVKILKHNKLIKYSQESVPEFKKFPAPHAAPLFDPVVGSKQERRDRKRKLNVAELFHKKRHRYDDPVAKSEIGQEEEKIPLDEYSTSTQAAGPSSLGEGEEWTCRWINGEPVGQDALLDCMDGQRPSVIVPDHRLPSGWVKHLSKRMYGSSAGKWDTILINPDGRKLRNKHEVKVYLEETKSEYNIDQFDFGLHLNRARKLGLYEVTDPEALAAAAPKPVSRQEAARKSKELAKRARTSTPKHTATSTSQPVTPETVDPEEEIEEEESTGGCLKIILENDSYKCPIEGCGKNFRKENLAQMHIKHYHPEYTKLLGSTPNVADLAYARTVGENIDDIVPKGRPVAGVVEKTPKIETTPKQKSTIKVLTPKVPAKVEETDNSKKLAEKSPVVPINPTNIPKPATKDAEIIRLLNSDPKSKGIDSIFEPSPPKIELFQKIDPTETNTEPVKFPENKLKELLYKSEPPKKEEAPTRPTGIKTLLPVFRVQEDSKPASEPPPPSEIDSHTKTHLKFEKARPSRKRHTSDNDSVKKRRQSLKYDTDEFSDYYEADSISQDSFTKKPLAETPPVQEAPQVIIEGGEVIRLVHMKREEIINCTCGITEEDGLMIQCELCLCWQHAHCNNIAKESQVPEKYICYICQNPHKMRSGTKYMHDQDWLKQGTLASADYHSKDQDVLSKRFENLRKSHELTGSLLELNDFIHNLRIKLNIAENKDHPKLYLWAKPWEKSVPDLTLNLIKKEEDTKLGIKQESSNSASNSDHSYMKGSTFGDVSLQSMLVPPIEHKIKSEDIDTSMMQEDMKIKSQSELISILEDGNENKSKLTDFPKVDLNSMISNNFEGKNENKEEMKESSLNSITGGLLSSGSLDLPLSQSDLERLSSLATLTDVANPPQPNIPQPEAAIDSNDCRMNLLEHIEYFQNLVDQKLNAIEAEITALENEETNPAPEEPEDEFPKTKQTLQMLIRDLSTMRQIAAISQ